MRTKAVVAVIAAFLLGVFIASSLGVWFVRRATQAPKIGNTATVIQQIQSLSELVTVKYVLQKVVVFTNAPSDDAGPVAECDAAAGI